MNKVPYLHSSPNSLHDEADEACILDEGGRVTAYHGVNLLARDGIAVKANVKSLFVDHRRYLVGGHAPGCTTQYIYNCIRESHF